MIRKLVLVLVLFLPVSILFSHLGDFVFQRASPYSDIAITHYPNGIFLQSSFFQREEWPLWSNTILSGYPFVANPLSGLHYPPGWLAFIFPLPLGFNISLIVHLIWGGIGVYLLARQEKLSFEPAFLSALVFESFPKIFAHIGAGHLTFIYAVCWTPWLLFIETRPSKVKNLATIFPGALLGLITLADIRWAAYAATIWCAYSFRVFLNQAKGEGISIRTVIKPFSHWLVQFIGKCFFAILIASPLLFPFLQYVSLSTRVNLSPSDNMALSLPPSQLFSLIFPNIGGSAEWVIYPGASVFGLVVITTISHFKKKKPLFWLSILLVSILFSLGSYFPFYENLSALPGFGLLRVPPRWMFLTGISFSILVGISLQSVFEFLQSRQMRNEIHFASLTSVALIGFVVFFAAAVWIIVPQWLTKIQFAWGAAFVLIVGLVILLVDKEKITRSGVTIFITSACLIDMIGVNALSLVFSPSSKVLSLGQEVVNFISWREGDTEFRVYSPSYSIPQQTAAYYGIELADGIDPMQMRTYASFMQSATGVISSGYSVTIPAFANGNPAVDNINSVPDARKLGFLNVKYVLSDFSLKTDQLRFLAQFGKTRIYQNPYALPRAWVQRPDDNLGVGFQEVELIRVSPNTISLTATGPGLLVLSEIFYPGWEVAIDAEPGTIVPVEDLMRGVFLTEGNHQVIFSFRPGNYYFGITTSTIAWVILVVALFLERRLT